MTVIFLTHAQVHIDPSVPVPDWGLTAEGQARHAAFARAPELEGLAAVFASGERKALDGAAPAAARAGLRLRQRTALGENDRSATGYLPPDRFERMADRFFAEPDMSVEGWERARDAQIRIVGAVRAALAEDRADGPVLIVAHGAVGALLRCHLKGRTITRDEDQPATGGGNWFAFDPAMDGPPTDWRTI
ncbi:MAG: histidine phosphatase family protein [Pseudomonadota bacterium]